MNSSGIIAHTTIIGIVLLLLLIGIFYANKRTVIPLILSSPTPFASVYRNTSPSPKETMKPSNTPQATITSSKQCGTVTMLGQNSPTDSAANVAESCFFQSYKECQAAQLIVLSHGVDTATTTTYSIKSKTCEIDGSSQFTMAGSHTQNSTTSFTCNGIKQTDKGLTLSQCGTSGDVTIPQAKQ